VLVGVRKKPEINSAFGRPSAEHLHRFLQVGVCQTGLHRVKGSFKKRDDIVLPVNCLFELQIARNHLASQILSGKSRPGKLYCDAQKPEQE
jgi:hypothetical protein